MRQKLYIAGIINLVVILTGTIFKISHLLGANILLTIGIAAFVLVFCPVALVNGFRRNDPNQSKLLYTITAITCFIVFTAMLFKIMHWPFAGIALTIALPFPFVVFLPVFVIVTSRDRNYNIYNVVFVLFLLALNSVLMGLLALNVAKSKIDDSLRMSAKVNNVKMALSGNKNSRESMLQLKIDEVLGVIDEYQETILKSQGTSESQWNSSTQNLYNYDSRVASMAALKERSDLADGSKLENALNSLLQTVSTAPGFQPLAQALPGILDLPTDKESIFPGKIYLTQDYLVWSLAYLDGLETSLRLLKTSL